MRNSYWRQGFKAAFAALCIYAILPICHEVDAQTQKAAAKKAADAKKAPKAKKAEVKKVELPFPPKLEGGKEVITVKTDDFLKAPDTIAKDVLIAKTAPTVDFCYYPGQDYATKIWSNWGDGVAANGKYYSSIGDHDAPNGNAFVYEWDPAKKVMRLLTDVASVLRRMMGLYVPGKIHSRIDMGKDGNLYFATHRGSTTITADKYGYKGDWIFRCDPKTGKTDIVVEGPVPKHCIPNSVLDPDRMIFYGGTAPGTDAVDKGVQFFAYDLINKKVLYSGPDGPPRYMAFARSTGKLYYVKGNENGVGPVMCYDPAKGGAPYQTNAEIGMRSATQETPQGMVYTISKAAKGSESMLFSFNTKTEEAKVIGPAGVGTNHYVTSIDADPTGRYLYYIPGAHGGSERDGTAIVQYDTKLNQRKVIAFLHPYFKDKHGVTLVGTFSTAVDPAGDKLYVTWNANRGSRAWDCCALTVVHIPESERQP